MPLLPFFSLPSAWRCFTKVICNQVVRPTSSLKQSFFFSSLPENLHFPVFQLLHWSLAAYCLSSVLGYEGWRAKPVSGCWQPEKAKQNECSFVWNKEERGVRASVLHMENIAGEPMTQKVMTGSCIIWHLDYKWFTKREKHSLCTHSYPDVFRLWILHWCTKLRRAHHQIQLVPLRLYLWAILTQQATNTEERNVWASSSPWQG